MPVSFREEDQTIDPIPQTGGVVSGKDNKAVKTCLQLIQDNQSAKSQEDAKNRMIRDLIEKGFEVREPDGPRRINVKKLYQAWWKTMQRVKLLDFTLHASQREDHWEKITTDGVSTVLRKSGYVSMFVDKGGLFQNGFGYGKGFGLFGTQEEGFPMKFIPLANDNVYVDARATAMRSGSKPVKKACVISSMSWAEFAGKYPEWAEITEPGAIPREVSSQELDQDYNQTNEEKHFVELARYYDIANKHFVEFAGRECTVNPDPNGEMSDEAYPFTFKNRETNEEENYIPVIHFSCLPSFQGFYDHGIFDSIYDLALLYQRIMNMQANYTIEGVDPINWLTVPAGQAGDTLQKMDDAMMMRAQGKKPFAIIEQDASNPGANQISAQSLQVQSLMNEAQMMFDRIDLEIKRFGISLDEPEAGNITATQILSDEENANRFVKQVMEMNASEFEFIINVVLDQIPKVVKKGNKTPLQMTTKVKVPTEDGGEEVIRPDGITLGMLSDELRKHEYFVKVNRRSGADMTKLLMAQANAQFATTQPGTPAYFELQASMAQMRDLDLDAAAFGAQPPAPPQAEQAGPPGQAAPAGAPQAEEPGPTEPISFNPRTAQQAVTI